MFIQYTATRALISGVTSGDSQDLTLRCSETGPGDFEIKKVTHQSIGGFRVHRVQSEQETFDIVTAPVIGIAENDKVKMFLRSVADGSTFSADLTNNVGLSMSSYQLVGNPGKPQRLSPTICVYKFTLVSV